MIKRGRRALLWIGGAHTGRKVILPDSLIHLLDRRFPNRTLVVHSVDRHQVSPLVSARLSPWPTLAAASVRHTWLGRLDVRDIGHRLSRGVVQDDVDAVLFWDPRSSAENAPRDADATLSAELGRRQSLAEATLPFRGGRIRFETDTATFTAESAAPLTNVLAELQRDTGLKLLVKAFADAREPNGLQLSLERANRILAWLTERGIDPARLSAKGCGSSRALWVGDTDEERAANRRAELVRTSTLADCGPPTTFAFR